MVTLTMLSLLSVAETHLLPELGAAPEALNDDVEETVVFTSLIAQPSQCQVFCRFWYSNLRIQLLLRLHHLLLLCCSKLIAALLGGCWANYVAYMRRWWGSCCPCVYSGSCRIAVWGRQSHQLQ